MFENAIKYWSKHVVLSSLSHTAGGFGAAVVLQNYIAGDVFVPVVVGWVALGFTLITHVIAHRSK